MPNTQKVSSSSLRGDKTFILLGSAQHVPQPQQKNGVVPLPILKQNKAIELVQKLAFKKPSYNETLFRLVRNSLFGASFLEKEAWKQTTKTTAQLTNGIETAPLVEQHHTCVVVVTCAYTHKVNNSYLRFDESFRTSTSAQETTVNSDNWIRKTRKLNRKESQAIVSVQ